MSKGSISTRLRKHAEDLKQNRPWGVDDDYDVSLLLAASEVIETQAARIRELEQQLAASNASCESLRASAVSLSKDVAAHEKVCAGRWVDVKERLPATPWSGDVRLGHETFAKATYLPNSRSFCDAHDGSELWGVTHWHEFRQPKPAKQPDEGVKS